MIGEQPARDVLLSGRVLTAEAALSCGLLTHLTGGDRLNGTVNALIDQARDLDPASIATLLANTRRTADHAREDMAALVASVARLGLHHRITRYRANEARSRTASSTGIDFTDHEPLIFPDAVLTPVRAHSKGAASLSTPSLRGGRR